MLHVIGQRPMGGPRTVQGPSVSHEVTLPAWVEEHAAARGESVADFLRRAADGQRKRDEGKL